MPDKVGYRIWEYLPEADKLLEHYEDGTLITLCGKNTWSESTDPINDPIGEEVEYNWYSDHDRADAIIICEICNEAKSKLS